jgi:AcrR family transcriptional regulator
MAPDAIPGPGAGAEPDGPDGRDEATPYERAEAAGREVLRRALLDAAGRILAEQGPPALTVRRVAQAVGCSTTVLYTLFGGKEGLVDALYTEGFARLRAAMAGAAGDPLVRLRAMGHAYRRFALANPSYYAVMFGRPASGGAPPPVAVAAQQAVLGVLADAVSAAVASGDVATDDPGEVAEVLWAAAHGAVSLELAGHVTDPALAERRCDTLLVGALMPFLVAG